MYPVIANIDALGGPLRTYPVLLLLAALAGMGLALPRLRRLPGVDGGVVLRVMLWCVFGAWLGGRLHDLSNLGAFALGRIVGQGRVGELFGVSFHAGGAILGLVIAALLATRHYGVKLGQYGDAVVPGFGLGLAIGRFACFLNGCCTGTPCSYFWCVAFPKPTYVWNYHVYLGLVPGDAEWSAPVHPLQLYFTAAGLAIMALGWWLDARKRYDGEVALMALLVFSASNAFLEQFRGFAPMRRYWLNVPQLTWIALVTMVATLVAIAWCERTRWRARRHEAHDALGEVTP